MSFDKWLGVVAFLALSGSALGSDDCKIDTTPPSGRIIAPVPISCHGPNAVPVIIHDNFIDTCDPAFERTYTPQSQIKLVPIDGARDDQFGVSASVANEVVVVGSVLDDDR